MDQDMILNWQVVVLALRFGAVCAIFGAIAVVLDFLLYFLRDHSILKLKHGKNTFLFLLSWSLGAFGVGLIGNLINVFMPNVQASITVGIAWPIICTNIFKKVAESQSTSEPRQV